MEGLEAWGGTSLYDAIHYGLGRIRDQPGRKAVIVFSDGADTTSSMKEQEVIDYARSVEATVYSIGIRGESGLLARSPRGFLRKVAQETGGQYFFPDKVGELDQDLRRHLRRAAQPLPPGLHAAASAGRDLARDRGPAARAQGRRGPGAQGLLRGEAATAAGSDHQQLSAAAPPRADAGRPAKRV